MICYEVSSILPRLKLGFNVNKIARMSKMLYAVVTIANGNVLYSVFELSKFGYFERGVVEDLSLIVSKECIQRSIPNQVSSLEKGEYICYATVIADIGYACVCDKDYPPRVMTKFLMELIGKKKEEVTELMKVYQDPTKADKISAIHKELKETKEVCHNIINRLIIREEDLVELGKKAEDLKWETQVLAGRAEDLNKCCVMF